MKAKEKPTSSVGYPRKNGDAKPRVATGQWAGSVSKPPLDLARLLCRVRNHRRPSWQGQAGWPELEFVAKNDHQAPHGHAVTAVWQNQAGKRSDVLPSRGKNNNRAWATLVKPAGLLRKHLAESRAAVARSADKAASWSKGARAL